MARNNSNSERIDNVAEGMDANSQCYRSPQAAAASYRGRVRSGCITCRARKVKCDERRPNCHNCTRLKKTCLYKSFEHRRASSAAESMAANPSQQLMSSATQMFPRNGMDANQTSQEDFLVDEQFQLDAVGGTNISLDVLQPCEGLYQSFEAPELSDVHGYFLLDVENANTSLDVLPPHENIYQPCGVAELPEPQWYNQSCITNGVENSDMSFNHYAGQLSSQDVLLPATTIEPLINHSPSYSPFSFFLENVEPPFISSCDPANWNRLKYYTTELGARNLNVAAAITAVQALYKAQLNGEDTTNAISLYFAAKTMYGKMLEDDAQELHTILVVTFLLCSFEIVAQHETVSVTNQPDGAFVRKLEKGPHYRTWPPVSQRIEAWLRIFHARAMHLGGRGFLSMKVHSLLPNDIRETPSLRLLDPRPNVTTAALHDIICAPLFEFYLRLQHISIQTSTLNRHQRSRGTPADEREVHQVITHLRREIYVLWHSRTHLLRLEPSELRAHLSPAVAEPVITLVDICTATYFAQLVDLGRTLGDPPLAAPDAKQAMRKIRRIVDTSCAGSHKKPDSGYLWPLFLYALESMEEEEAQWAVERLRQIKDPICHSDFVAKLANDITEEQMSKGRRLDVRYFCSQKYGVQPPFI